MAFIAIFYMYIDLFDSQHIADRLGISTICQIANCVETLESECSQLLFKLESEIAIFILSTSFSLPCWDLNPRPCLRSEYQADALLIELSWVDLTSKGIVMA